MRGQIISRGKKTYLLRVSLGRDATGKRLTYNETFHGTKKAAGDRLTEILSARSKGTFHEPTKLTVNEFLDHWLDTTKARVRSRTVDGYSRMLSWYIRPQLGERPLAQLTPLDIQRRYAEMLEGGLSARTVRYAHAILRRALSQAVKWRMLAVNSATAVDLPRLAKREMHVLNPEQAATFLEAAAQSRAHALLTVALTSGMRPGEYLGLKWPDVVFEQGAVTVRRVLVPRRGGGWELAEPKTPQSRRTIPLPASVMRLLVEHRRQQAAAKLKAGADYAAHDFVFATVAGEPFDLPNLVRRVFKPLLRTAGLPSIRLYDLRHTHATLLLAQGVHPKVVSERLGHASVTLTLDTYSHVLPTMQQAVADKLERMLFAG